MKHRIRPIVGDLAPTENILALEQQIRRFNETIADLLDRDDVEAFPSHFLDDCTYQVVSRENYAEGLPAAAIYCDGVAMERDRVVALRQTQVYAPRVWRHFISGTRVTALDGEEIHARANFMVTEAMPDEDPTLFLVGEYLDILVRDGISFKFKQRLAVFDNHHITRSLIVPI